MVSTRDRYVIKSDKLDITTDSIQEVIEFIIISSRFTPELLKTLKVTKETFDKLKNEVVWAEPFLDFTENRIQEILDQLIALSCKGRTWKSNLVQIEERANG